MIPFPKPMPNNTPLVDEGIKPDQGISQNQEIRQLNSLSSILKNESFLDFSHEIRTPMNGIIGMVNILLETSLTKDQKDYALIIRNSAESLLAVFNDIFDNSLMPMQPVELEAIDFDLRVTLDELLNLFSFKAVEKDISFIHQIDPSVPSFVRGDAARLRQIINKIIGNAIKYTIKGSVSLHVTCVQEDQDFATIRFEVIDTGVGISQERLQTIFYPQVQENGAWNKYHGGKGNGLLLIKSLIEQMKGTLNVESVQNKGSTFWFTIQLKKSRCEHENGCKPLADISNHLVLLVDDNAINRKILSLLMKSWGCSFKEAQDGYEALTLLRSAFQQGKPFDIAIIDMQMPGMNGEELGKCIKKDENLKNILLVMLTSVGMRGDAKRAEEIGFSAYLTKPLKQKQLYHCLATILSMNRNVYKKVFPQQLVTQHSLAESSKHALNVMIIDKDAEERSGIATIIKNLGYRCGQAAQRVEAIDKIASEMFQVIILDCDFDEFEITEFCYFVKAHSPFAGCHEVVIIALVDASKESNIKRYIELGMKDHLIKPIEPKELAQKIQHWIKPHNEVVPISFSETQKIFNPEDIKKLYMDDTDLIHKVIAEFKEAMPLQIQVISDAVMQNDLPLIQSISHIISEAFASIGGYSIQNIALRLEEYAVENNIQKVQETLQLLQLSYSQLFGEIDGYLESNLS